MKEEDKNERLTSKDVILKLCTTINKAQLTEKEIKEILSGFLFSIGASLENCTLQSSEEVVQRYAEKPTFGNALMAQALWMKETWTIEQNETKGKPNA